MCCALHWRVHSGYEHLAKPDMPCPLMQSEVAVSTHAASKWLVGQRMVAWDMEQQRWGPTTLGNAVMASSMDPDVALEYIQVSHDSSVLPVILVRCIVKDNLSHWKITSPPRCCSAECHGNAGVHCSYKHQHSTGEQLWTLKAMICCAGSGAVHGGPEHPDGPSPLLPHHPLQRDPVPGLAEVLRCHCQVAGAC